MLGWILIFMYKVYYKYADVNLLAMTKGDLINECNQIEALSKVADVYYGHKKYLGKYAFSMKETKQNYDVYIIRANKKEFMAVPKNKKKIWIASPYDIECFRNADVIATFTVAWELALKRGMQIVGLNPLGRRFGNARSICQCLGYHFKPKQGSLVKTIRSQLGDVDLVIGHFGRVSKTNYPYLLRAAWPYIKKKFKRVVLLAGVTKDKFPLPGVIQHRIPYGKMPDYLSACDVIIINQHGAEWDVCGNLKVKEAAACGIPVILEKSAARVEELGSEYPLFLPRGTLGKHTHRTMITKLLTRIEIAVELKDDLKSYLVDKMESYTIEQGAVRWRKLLGSLFKR
jgi:glycosyltransferase involved in cell wall biosynthesis